MNRRLGAAAFLGLILSLLLTGGSVDAQATLESADPPIDALLAYPPTQIELTFSEPVPLNQLAVWAVDESGDRVGLGRLSYGSDDQRTVRVIADGLEFGLYSVTWAIGGDAPTSGSFGYDVAGTSAGPTGSRVDGDLPPIWSVLARWLTTLALAPAVGLLLVAPSVRRTRLAIVGGLIAIVLTLAMPILTQVFKPESAWTGNLWEAIHGQRSGWFLRLAGLTVLLLILVAVESTGVDLRRAVSAAGLLSLAGIILTTPTDGPRILILALLFVAAAALLLLLGAWLHLLVEPPNDLEEASTLRLAPVLSLVALVTGITGLVLLVGEVDTFTSTDLGVLSLAGMVLLAFVLAGVLIPQDRGLGAGAMATALIAPILLATGVLVTTGLVAPVSGEERLGFALDLAIPTSTEITTDQTYVRLSIDPPRTGRGTLLAYATDGPPMTVDTNASGGAQRVDHPPMTDVTAMSVLLESLDPDIAPRSIELDPLGEGWFGAAGIFLPVEGWWQATVQVQRPNPDQNASALFIFRMPDPNESGFDDSRVRTTDVAAEETFMAARDQLAGADWAVFTEFLSGGNGGVELSQQTWSNGGFQDVTPRLQLIRLEGKRYLLDEGGVWRVTDDSEPQGPEAWMRELDGATDFRFGQPVTIDDRQLIVVHFFVPGSILAAAFYTWWIDPESGHVEQVAMVSTSHYMIRHYDWSAEPEPLVPPVTD
ncbi:MAG: copper resistance protein CopC [Chloroflexota bacterium]|nr:copper resistance protein CopC [Chloroflexota bacterium]